MRRIARFLRKLADVADPKAKPFNETMDSLTVKLNLDTTEFMTKLAEIEELVGASASGMEARLKPLFDALPALVKPHRPKRVGAR